MEDICINCKQLAKVSCSCDNSLRLCSDCFLFFHKNNQANHDPINLNKIIKEVTQKIQSQIPNLYKLKSEVLKKSNKFISIIQNIVAKKLAFLQKEIEVREKVLEIRTEKTLIENGLINIRESDLEMFEQIVNESFLFFMENNQIVDTEENKLESFKFSKDLTEIKKQLQSHFNLFFEGHTSCITSVAVTCDNEYMVSGSQDKTIRM